MARVTVEDCLKTVPNRFDLILVAAKRTHQLNSGTHRSTLSANGDKSSVVALREIAQGLIDKSILKEIYEIQAPNGGITMDEVEAELSETALEESGMEMSGFSEDNP